MKYLFQLNDIYLQIIIATYGELDRNNYLDPRTAQVATIDHIKQVMLHITHHDSPAILNRSVVQTVQLMF